MKKKKSGRRSLAEKEATRDALIASGMALFAKHGLDAPSLDDICAHAGYTRGAFYVHFEDRDDFLVAVMDHFGKKLITDILAVGEDGIAAAAKRFVDMSAAGKYPTMPGGGIRPHQLLQACARSRRLREHYLGLVEMGGERIRQLVSEGQRTGIVRPELDPARAATLFIAIVVGVQTLADLGVQIPVAEIAGDVVALVGGGGGV